ncbi:uncharacterized protein ACA1_090070 [Acanthamoeba castellanii str. Neff]|uniref:Uncharacterized protein n=1 Tax=Acanthamoeba castellanii (strain ATCC 30010 / Neff) TaxID=1257118 RepID=L8GU51_ACACF|nr:uncharacterized protein ACA1_090070 [Acanthamoeba castellanii str. Neff]ELR16709.1 hypothetical protein ACA1_090070 [Acanthamoeba castellanii str. Neff]
MSAAPPRGTGWWAVVLPRKANAGDGEGDDGAESEDVAGREEGVVAVDDDSGGDEDEDDDDNDEKEADRSGLLSAAAGDGAGDPGDGAWGGAASSGLALRASPAGGKVGVK